MRMRCAPQYIPEYIVLLLIEQPYSISFLNIFSLFVNTEFPYIYNPAFLPFEFLKKNIAPKTSTPIVFFPLVGPSISNQICK